MAQRKQRQHSHCPRCQATDEHLLHILTCPDPSTKDLHSKLVGELQEFSVKIKTRPDITTFFTLGLSKWFNDQSLFWSQSSHIFTNNESTNKSISSQISIGWFPSLCGFISSALVETQQVYLTEIGSRKSSRRWATELIKHRWRIIHQHGNTEMTYFIIPINWLYCQA